MPPLLATPLIKWGLGVIAGAIAARWAMRESRRVNEELDRVRTAQETDSRHGTLRRDPQSGEWRIR